MQQWKKSEQSLKTNSDTSQISIYSGALTKTAVAKSIVHIKASFPTLPSHFYSIFAERIEANGFSDQRLIDSVNYVIDNCPYPQPTIAQFISYDKNVKLYTYTEYTDFVTAHRSGVDDTGGNELMKAVKVSWSDNPMFALVSDIDKYKLETFKK